MKYRAIVSFFVTGVMTMLSTAAVAGAAHLSASPTSGKAPLLVQFTIVGGKGNYRLDFGDGHVVGPAICMEGEFCHEDYKLSHTYEEPGIFIVILKQSFDNNEIDSVKIESIH